MNSFEINKIITAILVTILVVFGIGKISDIILANRITDEIIDVKSKVYSRDLFNVD